jgi:hypothetical protein
MTDILLCTCGHPLETHNEGICQVLGGDLRAGDKHCPCPEFQEAKLPTDPEEIRQMLIEMAQMVHTIEFLHGCLTDPIFSYEYPEQTLDLLEHWRELVKEAPRCTAGMSPRHPPGPCPIHKRSSE